MCFAVTHFQVESRESTSSAGNCTALIYLFRTALISVLWANQNRSQNYDQLSGSDTSWSEIIERPRYQAFQTGSRGEIRGPAFRWQPNDHPSDNNCVTDAVEDRMVRIDWQEMYEFNP